jgi:hypothetical protein
MIRYTVTGTGARAAGPANLLLLLLAAALLCLPGCSRREVFDSETAAKKAVAGKSAHDVIQRLGAPNSVSSGGNFDDPNRRYTEVWKYSRLVRDRKSGELKTLEVFFFRGKAVSAGIAK